MINNPDVMQNLQEIVDNLESDQWFRRLDTAHTQILSALCTIKKYIVATGDNDALDIAVGLATDLETLKGLIEKEEMKVHNSGCANKE